MFSLEKHSDEIVRFEVILNLELISENPVGLPGVDVGMLAEPL
ncbi:hypothetical protein GCM10010301_73380 [Streptomyces plicatus]|nr:hypothetical protein GCM10010301_73380 [Streptomyces plicatus]